MKKNSTTIKTEKKGMKNNLPFSCEIFYLNIFLSVAWDRVTSGQAKGAYDFAHARQTTTNAALGTGKRLSDKKYGGRGIFNT
jgi:hypothetical protein